MQKLKRSKVLLVAILIFSIVTINSYTPDAKAASFTSAKDTLSDSDLGATGVTHTVAFTMSQRDLTPGEYVRVTLGAGFVTTSATSSCPTNTTASSTGSVFDCVVDGAVTLASTSQTMTISDAENPGSSAAYDVTITAYTSAGVEIESSALKVYIIDDVYMTATVPATLTFTIAGIDAETVVNGATCTATTTATEAPFGSLTALTPATVCQELSVSTNATGGFTVTVQQSDELTSAAGANINSFNNSPDDTGSSTPDDWASPAGTVGADHTYGHMGLTSEDDSAGIAFGVAQYIGFNNTDAVNVFHHTGVSNGAGANEGITNVAYTAEISALQEAGDYETYLTYIATPTY